jgi:hypothetical protein
MRKRLIPSFEACEGRILQSGLISDPTVPRPPDQPPAPTPTNPEPPPGPYPGDDPPIVYPPPPEGGPVGPAIVVPISPTTT